jgi:hypothetical protein
MSHIAEKETAYDKAKVGDEHFHSASKVYPTGTTGAVITSASDAWTLGNFTEIVPVNTITEDFDIHWVNIEGVSADGIYEIVLYAATTEIGRMRFTATDIANATFLAERKMQTKILFKNTQIQAKVMTDNGGQQDTVTISLHYHTY